MFKFIFRIISLAVFLILVIIAIAVWKGGGPFRLVGEGTVIMGEKIKKFGDLVDEIKEGGEKVGGQLIEMKENLDTLKSSKQEETEQKNKNGTSDKDKKSE